MGVSKNTHPPISLCSNHFDDLFCSRPGTIDSSKAVRIRPENLAKTWVLAFFSSVAVQSMFVGRKARKLRTADLPTGKY